MVDDPQYRLSREATKYFIQSLVDAARTQLDDDAVMRAVHVWRARGAPRNDGAWPLDFDAFERGSVNQEYISGLFPKTEREQGAALRSREVIVAPLVYARPPFGAAARSLRPHTVVPLLVAADLREDGTFSPREGPLPWVPRTLLEPIGGDGLTLGTLNDLEDVTRTLYSSAIETWPDLTRACAVVFEAVLGCARRLRDRRLRA